MMGKLTLVVSLGALLGLAVAQGCTHKYGSDCNVRKSCPEDAAGGTSGAGGHGDGGNGGAGACDAACGGEAPVCDAGSGECVGCTASSGCDEGMCDTEAHECVECLESTDCTSPSAARCDAGECKPCTSNGQCAGIEGKELCHEATGECVECLPGEHDTCGAGQLCHGELRQCVEAEAGVVGSCQPCVADTHCGEGLRCVQPDLRGEEGYFCLPEPNPGCDTRRPFVQRLEDLATVDGETATVCGHRFTSCAGFNHFSTAVDGCSMALDPPPGEGDGACGLPGTADNTHCQAFEAGARCTYQCSSKDDCKCGHDCISDVCALTTSAGGECD